MENNSTTSVQIAKRHPTREIVQMEIHGRAIKIQCRMNNLSITGAFLELTSSNVIPKQGDLVRMTITLRQINKTHTVHGQIIWCRGLGLGVSFLKDKELYELLAKSARLAT